MDGSKTRGAVRRDVIFENKIHSLIGEHPTKAGRKQSQHVESGHQTCLVASRAYREQEGWRNRLLTAMDETGDEARISEGWGILAGFDDSFGIENGDVGRLMGEKINV